MKGKIIGIDPGLTATGIVLAYPEGKSIKIIRHSVMGAEGETWYEKCDDLARRIKLWIMDNTEPYDLLYVMIEEPTNMVMSRAWSAALQNRLLSLIVDKIESIGGEAHRIVKFSIIHPITMKKLFTGNGRAKKPQIIKIASKLYTFRPNHSNRVIEAVSDAIGIAYCCWLYYRDGEEEMKGINNI